MIKSLNPEGIIPDFFSVQRSNRFQGTILANRKLPFRVGISVNPISKMVYENVLKEQYKYEMEEDGFVKCTYVKL